MAKKKTRCLGDCRTIGQLISDLKKNFDPEDAISILTLLTVKKDAELDLEHNSTKCDGSTINNISYSLQSIDKYRKECKKDEDAK